MELPIAHEHLKFKRAGSLVGFIFALAISASGQTPANDAETLQGLLKRIEQLEAKASRVDELESELTALKSHVAEPSAPIVPAEKWPRLTLQVLGSVDFHASNVKDETKQFELGDIDIVATAHLNEQASVVADFVVASNHGGFDTEIERLVASYKFNDHFNLDVGRFHTAIGWYNNFYHNGTYFQTTQDRPEPFIFEDNGGILPVHSVGLSLNGEISSGSANLSYSFEVANGRNYSADSVHGLSVDDDNNYKSVNFQLRAKPERLANWQFSAGVYHDTLTPEVAPGILARVDQFIFSGSAVYKSPSIEWFNEFFAIGDEPSHEHRHWTAAGYSQLSKKFGRIRPYVRLQWRSAAERDLLLQLLGQNTSVWGPQLGIRYDFTSMMAAKFEVERSQFKDGPAVDEFFSQLAFRF